MSDSFDLQVTFHGLISLVPTGEGEFLVVLPNLSGGLNPRPPTGDDAPRKLPEPIPPHLACIVVDKKYVVGAGDQTSSGCSRATALMEYQAPAGSVPRQMFRFERERLTLRYQGSEAGVSTETIPELQSHQTQPGEAGAPGERNLAWMPALERTEVAGAGSFEGRLLTSDLVPSVDLGFDRLIGTVLVRSGTLALSSVVRHPDGGFAVVRFAAEGQAPVFSQAFFESLIWTGSVPSGGLEVVLASGDPGFLEERCIALEERDGKLEIDIFNRELEDILLVGFDTTSADEGTDPDFAVGYYMSKAWPDLVGAQAVIPTLPEGIAGSGEACKTGRFTMMEDDPRS